MTVIFSGLAATAVFMLITRPRKYSLLVRVALQASKDNGESAQQTEFKWPGI